MNTDTGRIYELGQDFNLDELKVTLDENVGPGLTDGIYMTGAEAALTIERYGSTFISDELGERQIPPGEPDRVREHADLAKRALGRDLKSDEIAALRDALRGDTIVPVSAQVAHTMRVGEREVGRRKRRRKAVRQARKRNR